VLAGGPGQSALEVFGSERRRAFLQSIFPGYTLVLYDDRGTGSSEPISCDDAVSLAPARHFPRKVVCGVFPR